MLSSTMMVLSSTMISASSSLLLTAIRLNGCSDSTNKLNISLLSINDRVKVS